MTNRTAPKGGSEISPPASVRSKTQSSNGPVPTNGRKPPPRVIPPESNGAPPHNLEAEAAVLGAMLVRPKETITEVRCEISADDYYLPSHQSLHEAICALADRNDGVDSLTAADELSAVDPAALEALGGLGGLLSLIADCPSTSNVVTYARLVAECAWRRRVIGAGRELVDAAGSGDADKTERALLELSRTSSTRRSGRDLWEDVAAAMRGEVDPIRPTLLQRSDERFLMYPAHSHWLMGESGQGKTWIALHLAAEVLRAGGEVVYLDWEGSRSLIGERLCALGVSAELVEAGLGYHRPGTYGPSTRAAVAARCRDNAVQVVVLDGVAKALTAQGVSEDKSAEFLRWWEDVVTPLTDVGAAVLALDHVTKEREGRGLWARGSGAKRDAVTGAAWMLVPRAPFSREKGGRVELRQAKDRLGFNGADGDVVAAIEFVPSNAGASLSVSVLAPSDAALSQKAWRPTRIMKRISQVLEGEESEELATKFIVTLVGARKQTVLDGLEALVEDGYLAMRKGPNNQRLYRTLRVYRQPAIEEPVDADQGRLYEDF